MTVRSSKTERQGKPSRVVPILASLRPYLEQAFELATDGAVYCVARYRSQDVNLRTGLERIINKASVPQWERLWHNLRASAETDLVRSFPAHVAAQWLGHTPIVAVKHYLTVIESDYEKATNFGVGRQVGQKGSESSGIDGQPEPQESQQPREKQSQTVFPVVRKDDPIRLRGFEPPTYGLGNRRSIP